MRLVWNKTLADRQHRYATAGEPTPYRQTGAPLRVAWSWPDIDMAMLEPTTVVASREPDGRWYVTFAVEAPDPVPQPPAGRTVGVDVGVKDFAVLSTGERIPNPRHLTRRERNLKRYQKMMARKQRGSANRAKAARKVARAHSEVREARRDFLHKTSTRIVAEHDRIGIEDLAVANMVRNHTLAKAIHDAGWATFRTMLGYKAHRAGRHVVAINRWYPSSKTCSECGHLLASLSLGTRHWTCPGCGTRHDRDINAAKNIDKAAGLVASASGGPVRPDQVTDRRGPMNEESRPARAGTPTIRRGEKVKP